MIFYHGSNVKIIPNHIEIGDKGTMQEGPGLYLTTCRDDAVRYIDDEHGYLTTFDVNIPYSRLVPIVGRKSRKKIERLVKSSPWLDEALENWDENKGVAINKLLNNIYRTGSPHDAFQLIWYDVYHMIGGKHGDMAFIDNMVKIGYDGVIVDRSGGVKHLIVYNPDCLSIVQSVMGGRMVAH